MEREGMLERWNRSWSEYPREQCVHELFEGQVERAPQEIAVVYGDERLSYRELDERANALAERLIGLGVGAETVVGVCLERSVELVVSLLGILKAGGAYLPLDPEYPAARLEYMLQDARARVLVTHSRLGALRAAAHLPVVHVDERWDGGSREGRGAPVGRARAQNLVYVIYTSGSTGSPKGIGVTHQAVVRLVQGTDYVRLGAGDRVAQLSNSSFDAATFEIWGALCGGGTLVMVGREVVLSPARLGQSLQEQGVRVLFLTTALFNEVAREMPGCFAGVRELLFGGGSGGCGGGAAGAPGVRS